MVQHQRNGDAIPRLASICRDNGGSHGGLQTRHGRFSGSAGLSLLGIVFMFFIAGLAAVNASGVFSQLVSAHVGERGVALAAVEMLDAEVAGKIEVAAGRVGDLDRRIGQTDSAIEEAAKHGKATAALSAIDGQRKARRARR
jgi:hypothetical protein